MTRKPDHFEAKRILALRTHAAVRAWVNAAAYEVAETREVLLGELLGGNFRKPRGTSQFRAELAARIRRHIYYRDFWKNNERVREYAIMERDQMLPYDAMSEFAPWKRISTVDTALLMGMMNHATVILWQKQPKPESSNEALPDDC